MSAMFIPLGTAMSITSVTSFAKQDQPPAEKKKKKTVK
jgi:hypothetical protein